MDAEPLVSVRNLGKRIAPFRWIVKDVSFDLAGGRTLALVGPSGAGKSTLARCLALLETPDAGEVRIAGREPRREDVQLIPQQPAASFNPRFTAGEVVAEPLAIQKRAGRKERSLLAAAAMTRVGLPFESAAKPVMHFSGGEHQRLALARALTLEPKLLILDESLSALDAASQDQQVRLLQNLGLTYIVISHDLDLAEKWADEIAIMHDGRIVEHRPATELLASPRHPVSQELVHAHLVLSSAGPEL